MHTNEDKMMLFCVGSRNEIVQIKRIAINIDKRAFMVVFNAREAWGKGFEKEIFRNRKKLQKRLDLS